uniref:IPT/TIG domain-containing protein n=1 Tax=Varanus komodoensis TaxID=61221 RepID=A0A8D2LUW8_VARKO
MTDLSECSPIGISCCLIAALTTFSSSFYRYLFFVPSSGEGLNLGISKDEVRVIIGNSVCTVKTLTLNHLYCEPPLQPPQPLNVAEHSNPKIYSPNRKGTWSQYFLHSPQTFL